MLLLIIHNQENPNRVSTKKVRAVKQQPITIHESNNIIDNSINNINVNVFNILTPIDTLQPNQV